jgi:hypothetical protein
MQEEAFERRDAILEKMKQEQDARAVQLRMREKSTTRRETALVSEEARQLRENTTLEAAKTALRKDQHALKLKQVHRSAAMSIQVAVRGMLRKRAAHHLVHCEKLQKELDKRERDVGELEALHKSRAADLSTLKVRLELQEAATERELKTLRHREVAAQRRTEDVLRSEERHREIQSETEERDLRSVEREEETRQASERAAERERQVEDANDRVRRALKTAEEEREAVMALRAEADER